MPWCNEDLRIWGFGAMRIWGFGVNVQNMMKLGSTEQWSHLKKLIFDFSWPLPTLYDFVNIHDLKLLENSSLMTLFPTQSEKFKFWPLLTLKMTSDHGKSYISENYMKNQVEWHPAQLNLIKLKNQPPAPFIILHRPPKG